MAALLVGSIFEIKKVPSSSTVISLAAILAVVSRASRKLSAVPFSALLLGAGESLPLILPVETGSGVTRPGISLAFCSLESPSSQPLRISKKSMAAIIPRIDRPLKLEF